MKAERKKAWTDALRSGKYKQGRARLRSADNDFCCLGVLCDITDPNAWSRDNRSFAFRGRTYNLPPDLEAEIGGINIENFLIDTNDSRFPVTSFDQIADLIEEVIPVDKE
jgi:hypothetical protein